MLALQSGTCELFELYLGRRTAGGWLAASGARFDLRSNALRPLGWTSADAAGLPILPGLVRYEEVASGEIRHAIRFILPNMLSPVIVYTTTLIGLMIVVGSGLSFLGLGVQPPTADWGTMVSDGRVVLKKAPHVTIFPGIAIITVSLAFAFLGDGLREALDPKAIRR